MGKASRRREKSKSSERREKRRREKKREKRREKSKSSERREKNKWMRLLRKVLEFFLAKSFSSENEGRPHNSRSDCEQCLKLGVRSIGKLLVSSTEIGKGSNGTIVFEGYYENQPVAVKRLLRSHYDVAKIENNMHLIKSERRSNIVRYYGQENDRDFMYLALERADCNLDSLIRSSYRGFICLLGTTINLGSHPSLSLQKVMREVVSGLVRLHELGIIHRDLKPQNVLIIENCAQLSDMGISKCLLENKSSSGWQAPEQLLPEHQTSAESQTSAMDVFSLGCVLFFCITGGGHPFGGEIERSINIMNNKMDLSSLKSMPEARDLISRLLNRIPQDRPTASEVLRHPFFWSSEKRLSFLRDISDAAQSAAKPNSEFLQKLESKAPLIFYGNWVEKIDPVFRADLDKRPYDYSLVRDLLRVVRNKRAHYMKLSKEIKGLVGTVPEGFDNYFAERFPGLLTESYGVASECCKKDEWFQKYALSTKKKKYAT